MQWNAKEEEGKLKRQKRDREYLELERERESERVEMGEEDIGCGFDL